MKRTNGQNGHATVEDLIDSYGAQAPTRSRRQGTPTPKSRVARRAESDDENEGEGEEGDAAAKAKFAAARNKKQHGALTINAPNFKISSFKIRGIAPYVQHKFSEKARKEMEAIQEAGSKGKKKGGAKDPKDFKALYEAAKHVSQEGWCGIPAVAFYKAMVAGCRMIDFHMTVARQALFVLQDGWSQDPADRSGLVKITKGKPAQFHSLVRVGQNKADVRARPLWEAGWEATVRIRHDNDILSEDDVANLLMRAGMQVGVGEGRPDSRSGGQGWGLFEIVAKGDKKTWDAFKEQHEIVTPPSPATPTKRGRRKTAAAAEN